MGFGKDGLGVIINEKRNQALGALGQDTGIIIGTKLATLERFRMLKSEVHAVITGLTIAEGGGLALYLCDGDLSLTEIDQAIEANGPLGPNDSVQAATVERFTKLVGAMSEQMSPANFAFPLSDAKTNAPVCVVLPRWTFARTKSWNWVLYNHAGAIQTGATVLIMAKSFGVWVM